jgi:hypothetical protein
LENTIDRQLPDFRRVLNADLKLKTNLWEASEIRRVFFTDTKKSKSAGSFVFVSGEEIPPASVADGIRYSRSLLPQGE